MTTEQHDDGRLPQLRGLAMERSPERDLWPGIEARLVRRRQRAWLPYALAASLVAAVTVGIWDQARSPGNPVAVQPVPVASAAVTQATRRAYPQQQALLKANLCIVKDAERQLRQALAQDPQSRSLQRLLQTTQDKGSALKTRLQST